MLPFYESFDFLVQPIDNYDECFEIVFVGWAGDGGEKEYSDDLKLQKLHPGLI